MSMRQVIIAVINFTRSHTYSLALTNPSPHTLSHLTTLLLFPLPLNSTSYHDPIKFTPLHLYPYNYS